MKCEECIFWEEDKAGKPTNGVIMGYCRPGPPSATVCLVPKLNVITGKTTPTLIEITVWPKTRDTALCGAFKSKTLGQKMAADIFRKRHR